LESAAFLNKKCREDWVIQHVHGIYTRPPCPISEHSMVSPWFPCLLSNANALRFVAHTTSGK
jgi:hypothetical protein